MDNVKTVINKIKEGAEVYLNARLTLIGISPKVIIDDKGNEIKWLELLLAHNTVARKHNAPANCGIEELTLYKEYGFSFSSDEKTGRLKVVGVFTPEYIANQKN